MGLFSEIRRRNVFRMATLYIVGAWLVMQVAGELIDLAHLPDWIGPAVLALLALGFPIALTLSWFYELTPEGIARDKDVERGHSSASASGRRLDFVVISLLCAAVLLFAYDKWWVRELSVASLAVLPINAISADPEIGYLAEGMTDILTSQLGRIEALSVTSTTSTRRFRSSDKVLPEIARELNVDALLEGSIQQFEGKLRIGMKLVDGRTDRQLWSGIFDREYEDLLTLQGEIAATIADTINISLAQDDQVVFVRDRTVDPDALRFWALGNHIFNEMEPLSFERALQAFEKALEYDSQFAEAHAGIALVHCFRAGWFGSEKVEIELPLARAAANRALELDPDLAAAHFTLGLVHRMDRDWEASEGAFRKGMQLSRNISGFPSGSVGPVEYANLLNSLGRAAEAIEIAQGAVRVDPLMPIPHNELGLAYHLDGRYEQALEHYMRALQLDPSFPQTNAVLSLLFLSMGKTKTAIPYIDKLRSAAGQQSWNIRGHIGMLYGLAGRTDETREILSQAKNRAETEFVPAITFAYLHLGLKNYDEALKWLGAAYDEREFSLVWLRELWIYDPLREDPRFQDLLAKMDFPN